MDAIAWRKSAQSLANVARQLGYESVNATLTMQHLVYINNLEAKPLHTGTGSSLLLLE